MPFIFLCSYVLCFKILPLLVFGSCCLSATVVPFKYSDNSAVIKDQKFLQFSPLIQPFTVLCIFSKDEEIEDFFEAIVNSYKTIIYIDSPKEILQKTCSAVVIISPDVSQGCLSVKTRDSLASSIFFISLSPIKITHLEECVSSASSPEVISISLEDGLVHELSHVVLSPRHFIRSSVAEVLRHRLQPTKINLQGTTLSIATANYMPFFITKIVNNFSVEYDGMEKALVQEMAYQMNFSIKYLVFRRWGSIAHNGTWVDHLFGTMARGGADIAIANIMQTPAIYSIMDFGPSLSKEIFGFAVRRPERSHFQWRSILMIFEPCVWFATLTSFVFVAVVYSCSVNLNSSSYPGRKTTWCSFSPGLSGSIMVVLGHLIVSSFHRRKSGGIDRQILTLWSGFSLLFVTSLSTGIVTRLTLPSYTERVNTIKQLVEGQYYWTADFYKRLRNNTAMRELIFDLKDPWIKLYEQNYLHLKVREIHKRLYTDAKITFPVMKYGDHFVIFNTEKIAKRKELKNFRLAKQATGESHVSIGLKKHSPLNKSLYTLNLRFLELGLVDHWRSDVYSRWPEYDTSHLLVEKDIPTLGEPEQLTLYKLQPAFFLLLFGLAIATLVFIAETYWQHIKKSFDLF